MQADSGKIEILKIWGGASGKGDRGKRLICSKNSGPASTVMQGGVPRGGHNRSRARYEKKEKFAGGGHGGGGK